ncbi:MAG: hypothetical protein GEV06_26850 [Luteitalea sp.]|nr:hypothetical protein [Luteitalea sp.]
MQVGSPLSEILYSEKSESWHFPARYYSFTAGAAQFFQLDTVDLSERELRWLDEELAKSTAPWKVVYGHYQIYSATRGDNDAEQTTSSSDCCRFSRNMGSSSTSVATTTTSRSSSPKAA